MVTDLRVKSRLAKLVAKNTIAPISTPQTFHQVLFELLTIAAGVTAVALISVSAREVSSKSYWAKPVSL